MVPCHLKGKSERRALRGSTGVNHKRVLGGGEVLCPDNGSISLSIKRGK